MEPTRTRFVLTFDLVQNSEIPGDDFTPRDISTSTVLVRELFKRGEDAFIPWKDILVELMDHAQGFHPDTVVDIDVISVVPSEEMTKISEKQGY